MLTPKLSYRVPMAPPFSNKCHTFSLIPSGFRKHWSVHYIWIQSNEQQDQTQSHSHFWFRYLNMLFLSPRLSKRKMRRKFWSKIQYHKNFNSTQSRLILTSWTPNIFQNPNCWIWISFLLHCIRRMSKSLPYSMKDVHYDNAKFRQRSFSKVAFHFILNIYSHFLLVADLF